MRVRSAPLVLLLSLVLSVLALGFTADAATSQGVEQADLAPTSIPLSMVVTLDAQVPSVPSATVLESIGVLVAGSTSALDRSRNRSRLATRRSPHMTTTDPRSGARHGALGRSNDRLST